MALTKVTGGTISTTSNYEVGVITATKFVGPFEGEVTGNADSATTSTRVTVTDQASDTTCNVLFAQGATGDLLPHSNSNLTFNSETGALSASKFVGNIEATTIDVTGTLNYTNVTDIYSVGIITAASSVQIGAGLSVAGISTFSDNIYLPAVGAGNSNGNHTVLMRFDTGDEEGLLATDSALLYNPAEDTLKVNGNLLSATSLYGAGGTLKLAASNHSSTSYVQVTDKVEIAGQIVATQDYPNYRPTLDFNFIAVKKLDSRFTYQRTGPASYVDEFGFVRLVGYNEPRFDHDPATGESKGLLIEESRVNKFASSDAGASVWLVDGSMTKEANTTDTKDPAGTYTACKLMSVASANSTSQIYDGLSFSSGGVQSLWAKKGTHNVIGIFDYSGGSGIRAWYNLDTGVHRCEGGDIVAAGVQSSGNDSNTTDMIEYPNGWYRCIYYEAANMTYAHFRIVDFDADNEASASSNSIYVWGLQAEDGGVTYATSHIPCNTGSMPGTITRGDETVTMEGEEFTDFYNQEEGTIVLSASYTEDQRTSAIVTIDDTSNTSEYTEVGYRAGGSGSGKVGAYTRTDAGNDQYFKGFDNSATAGNEFKVAFGYKDNDYASSANGATIHTDTSGTTSKVFDRLRLNHVDSVSPPIGSGHIRRFIYYPKRLPNSQLVTLTA